jgi:hypothetical protein
VLEAMECGVGWGGLQMATAPFKAKEVVAGAPAAITPVRSPKGNTHVLYVDRSLVAITGGAAPIRGRRARQCFGGLFVSAQT